MPAVRDLPTPVRALLRGGPIVVPTLAATAVFAWLIVKDAGFFPETWYLAGLVLLALLTIALVAVPVAGAPPRLVLAAAALLAAYAGWSYLSITWADQNADAWDGANRTAVYACVFALFALWPLGRRGTTLLVGTIALGIGVIALIGLFRADPGAELDFIGGRYAWPTYPNGNAALWFMAFWPCVAFGARRELPAALRGAFLGAAVVLAATTLLLQSRGWLFAAPIVTVVFLLIVPNRVRTAWALLGVGAVTAAIAPTVLDVFAAFGDGRPVQPELTSAQRTVVVAALLTGMVGATLAGLDRRVHVSAAAARRTGAAMLATAGVLLALGLALFVAKEGNPATWLGDRWSEFKSAPQPTTASARFTQTLGSNRYDFWRVAWNRFEARPISGIGADNFRQDYLLARDNNEEPYYPHSIVLRTFAQTGLVGVLLLGGAIVCALLAAWQAIRRRRGIAATTAAAATTSFVYFLVHGSVDWFWELPALGCVAFALLGIAAGLLPRPAASPRTRRRALAATPLALAAVAIGAGVLGASFAGPWLSAREGESARKLYNSDRAKAQEALDMLDRAAALNPFTPRPRILAAKIEVDQGAPDLAAREFRDAIARDHRNGYAYVGLATVLSSRGDRAGATRAAERAVTLSPRDAIARDVLARVRAGRRLDFFTIDRRFSQRSSERVK